MRVAFDEQIFALQAYGGISRMFAELAKQFIHDGTFDVQLLPLNAPVVNRYLLDDEKLRTWLAVRPAKSAPRSLVRYFTRIQPRTGNDIVHNTFYLPNGLVAYPKAKRIVTVHDMIPELLPQTRRRADMLTLKKHYVERADHVICVSHATRHDLLRTYGEISAPISVIHHGVDPAFTPDREPHPELPRRYVLFVGNRSQYKDAAVLMRAFAQDAQRDPDLMLLFVGGGPFTGEEHGLLNRLGIAARTIQVQLPDHLMPAAYSNAVAFVFPSRFEGFGLPALEAMACGTPTILANSTSLPEVGADAALYFEPGDADALAAMIGTLLVDDDLRTRLSAAGIERAREFTWRRSAELTAAAYRETLAA